MPLNIKTPKRETLTRCFQRQVHLHLPSCSKNFVHGMDKSTKRTTTCDIVRLRYPGSRSPFLKYLRWNKPCLRFDKAPETDFCFSRRSLTSLCASRLVDADLPRQICIDKKKISSGTQGKTTLRPDNEHNFSQVRESGFRNPRNAGRPPLVFDLINNLTLNCGLQVKKYDFPNLQKLASIRGEIGENTPNT